jgi:hypothetical protein
MPNVCHECGAVVTDAYRVDPRSGKFRHALAWCVPCYERLSAATARDVSKSYEVDCDKAVGWSPE